MKRVYIDCGVWTGDSIKYFNRVKPGYDIYGFECEPRLTKQLKKLSKKIEFTFINKAVWIRNEEIVLYPGQGDLTQSSSIHLDKRKYIDKKHPVKVEGIDFSKWVLDNFDKNDYIICKMNIEGAEYDVLPKMLKDGSIDYINELYMSWHWRKLKKTSEKIHNKLVTQLEKRTSIVRWTFVENEKEDVF